MHDICRQYGSIGKLPGKMESVASLPTTMAWKWHIPSGAYGIYDKQSYIGSDIGVPDIWEAVSR